MKRILLSLLLAVVFLPLWAGDIIITSSSERIDAKIVEVSDTEVKYKRQDNLNGPTFVVSTSKIATIVYENGTVQAFEQKQQSAQPVYGNNAVNSSLDYQPGQIVKKDDFYFLGDKRMDEDQYLAYIQKNCEAAWDSYNKGCRLWRAGWGLFGAGAGLLSAGIITAACSSIGVYTYTYNVNTGKTLSSNYDTYFNQDVWTAGVVFCAVGSASMAGSVPLLVIGGIKRNNSHEVYNEECAPKNTASISLNLQASQNGLGLALKF